LKDNAAMFKAQVILLSLLLLTPTTFAAPPDPAGVQFFETKIRPVLAAHCYKCHSAEAASAGKLKGALLLDSREGVLKGGKNGAVIVPGEPEKSRLIEAIHYSNEDLQMPPKERLTAEAVADLEKWVAMGAPDPRAGAAVAVKRTIDVEAGRKFWSFQPLQHPRPPAVRNEKWRRTVIDQFVLAAQEEKGLYPNAIAPREKLIRRACFDLTGLPPSPEELSAFANDSSPDAYEKLLDRLLASPRYGERWARRWLDVARFAESDGFEHDSFRPAAYQYRDFVIRALNADMPFDRFAQLQIAGDEIAPGDWQAMAATGFLTAGVFPTQITEKEFEFTRYTQLDDMVSTTGNAMLGLTIGCARCHDHKFDPISTADYYRFVATFATAVRSDVDLDLTTPAELEKLQAEWKARTAALREKLAAFDNAELDKKFNEQIARVKKTPTAISGEWSILHFESIKTARGTHLSHQPDGSLLAIGAISPQETYTLTARTSAANIAAVRVEALTDKSLPHNGPGAAGNGNFVLTEIEVSAAPAEALAPVMRGKIVSASTTHEQNKGDLSVAASFDGKPHTGWAVDKGGIGKDQAAIFNLEKPIGFPGGTLLTVTLHFDHPNARHVMGRPRICISTRPTPKSLTGNEGADPAIVATFNRLANDEPVETADRSRARAWIASTLSEYQKLKAELEKLERDGPPKQLTKVQVTSEGLPPVKNNADGRGYPHFYKTVYLLRRGDPNNKLEPVTFSFPRVLMRGGKDESYWQTAPPPDSHTSYRRTALARWLIDTDRGAGNLLARVIVNRLWQHHFGQGIVATPNDFGAQGERPTHSELLDWLASDLVEHGWQLKRLHKLMMMSSVYTQDAQAGRDREAIDPHNAYLWRWQPRRLEAEPIRDAMLAVGGMLDETMFGPGTLDQNMRRRSIYFTVKRAQLIPMMMVLDWPEPLSSIGSRPSTTIAPQALLFMNSPQSRQYAEGFAKRVHSQSVEESIGQAYRTAFAREAQKSEVKFAAEFIARQAASYRETKQAEAEGAALADFCQALMSANEFVYID
jgi:hypothetical protein